MATMVRGVSGLQGCRVVLKFKANMGKTLFFVGFVAVSTFVSRFLLKNAYICAAKFDKRMKDKAAQSELFHRPSPN